ncbi:protein CDV3 homolog isoform X2 [Choristoneura fumiferana]|uniref:protein CDV3 homolog isoform X2 n=1 Tax=Choristoneura fumiferana TaxID=7141 RepID=UPI003D15CC91
MADLDDFFAKKDRKKKSVKKFATAEEMAKKLDDGKQKPEVRPKKERPVQEGEEGGRAGEEEEWKEYEEPVKDYTGLKIQVLQGGQNTPDTGRDPAAEDAAPDNGKTKGPWNKPQQQPAAPEPKPEPEKPKEVKPASTAYVPPVARVAARPEPLRRNAAKHAPDIHNDDTFPVLGAGGKREGGWSTAVAGSAAPRVVGMRQPLALGNRFTELQDDS